MKQIPEVLSKYQMDKLLALGLNTDSASYVMTKMGIRSRAMFLDNSDLVFSVNDLIDLLPKTLEEYSLKIIGDTKCEDGRYYMYYTVQYAQRKKVKMSTESENLAEALYLMVVMLIEPKERKVFCIGEDGQTYWAYFTKPEQLFKVGSNYERLYEPVDIKFKRWCTGMDL